MFDRLQRLGRQRIDAAVPEVPAVPCHVQHRRRVAGGLAGRPRQQVDVAESRRRQVALGAGEAVVARETRVEKQAVAERHRPRIVGEGIGRIGRGLAERAHSGDHRPGGGVEGHGLAARAGGEPKRRDNAKRRGKPARRGGAQPSQHGTRQRTVSVTPSGRTITARSSQSPGMCQRKPSPRQTPGPVGPSFGTTFIP